jgi:hypothetical protein
MIEQRESPYPKMSANIEQESVVGVVSGVRRLKSVLPWTHTSVL